MKTECESHSCVYEGCVRDLESEFEALKEEIKEKSVAKTVKIVSRISTERPCYKGEYGFEFDVIDSGGEGVTSSWECVIYCGRLHEKFDESIDWRDYLEGRQTFGVQRYYDVLNALRYCYQVAEMRGFSEDFNTVVAYQLDTLEYEVLDDTVNPDIDSNAKMHEIIISKQKLPAKSQITSFAGFLAVREKDSVENLIGRVAQKSLRMLKVLKNNGDVSGWLDVNTLVEIGRLSERLRWKVNWEPNVVKGQAAVKKDAKSGQGGGRSSSSKKLDAIDDFWAEIALLGIHVGTFSETQIFDVAWDTVCEKWNKKPVKKTREKYETYIRSEPPYRERYQRIFLKNA